ncbi:MAG: ABC transporter ATP-binding protein [Candidatus Rokubacteria bacterium]|nr:ABC transporter ATP-binding protein [Candidatus Rokubacteria bacterium]
MEVEKGEFLTLLGPSGCGKTTILQLIAGFLVPDAGQVFINGEPMAGVPPERRNIGIVFQSYALFPHMTVFENVAFGLTMRKAGREVTRHAVAEALELVRLSGLEQRFPKQLSGGQQQRVAIARAVAIRPRVLLFDEPLSNLDAKLRRQMRTELREIQRRVGITTVFVTHDQEEALTLSDRVAVMSQGRLQQVATPQEVYRRPATRFVADFLGETNALVGVVRDVDDDHLTMVVGDALLRAPAAPGLRPGARVALLVRPEHVAVRVTPTRGLNSLSGHLSQAVFQGARTAYVVRAGDAELISTADSRAGAGLGSDGVFAEWDAADSIVFALDE